MSKFEEWTNKEDFDVDPFQAFYDFKFDFSEKNSKNQNRQSFETAWNYQLQIIDQKDAEIEKLKKELTHVLDVSEVNLHEWFKYGLIECRGDEDCDHCMQLSAINYARQTLAELSEVESEL